MERKLAKIFSILFHPLIMTTLGMFIMFNSGTPLSVIQPEVKRVSLVVVFLFTCVFPVGLVVMLYLSKMIPNLKLQGRTERVTPVALIIIILLFTFFVMRGIPQLLRVHNAFILSASLGLFLALVLNNYMKPSLFMLGLGSLLGMMVILLVFYRAPLQLLFVLIILATGIAGTSRLILERHSPGELLAGLALGFFTTALTMIFA